MRATIHPLGIILTAALLALVSTERLDNPMSSLRMVIIIAFMGSRGVHAPEVFLMFTTQLHQYFSIYMHFLHYLVTILKYSFLNTPKQQYLTLFTSGG